MRKVLKRVDFDKLAATNSDVTKEYVHTPEWAANPEEADDTYVCIRSLSGTERDAYEASVVSFKGKDRSVNLLNARAKLVAMVLIDEETNEQLYKQNEINILGKRSAAALDRVFNAARKLSGLSEADVDELTEELKNDQSA